MTRNKLVRCVAKSGWKMTREERAELVKLVDAKFKYLPWVAYRLDRAHRRIFGCGEKPFPIAFGYGDASDWTIQAQDGRVWLAFKGLRVE